MQTTNHKDLPCSDAEKAEKARQARNQYNREYYKKNRDKLKRQHVEYWYRKAKDNEEAEIK